MFLFIEIEYTKKFTCENKIISRSIILIFEILNDRFDLKIYLHLLFALIHKDFDTIGNFLITKRYFYTLCVILNGLIRVFFIEVKLTSMLKKDYDQDNKEKENLLFFIIKDNLNIIEKNF
ncbi:hypothetical protein BpHYR1_028637 [Brachionus plicatilis]|uniref:Uncharacterized protein n=1 Tax=Brachionus plicatilis TaxID=10195 RepID=A0A3M7RCM9_BRAPC|nr:hypothetical protein BpHYR1_028637 [Brachionus plicatilis]